MISIEYASTNILTVINEYYISPQHLLCTTSPDWNIVGVCHLSGRLWIVVDALKEPLYLVYEFAPRAVYRTVLDLEAIERVAHLQEIWPVDKSIRSEGTKIKTMFALYPHQYDRSKVVHNKGDNKKSDGDNTNQTTGGIVFVFDGKVSLWF